MSGGSESSGKLSTTPETRSRISFAAASISCVTSNSMLIRERPSEDVEEINLIPSTPEIRSSITSVIRVSTVCAEAPG